MISLKRPSPMYSVVCAVSSMISASLKCSRRSVQKVSSTLW